MAQVRVNQKQVLSLAQLQEEDIIADTQQSFVINEKKEENEKIATGTAKVDVVVTVNQELEQQQKAIVDEKVALLAQEKVHAKKKTSAKVCLKVTGTILRILACPIVALFAFFRWLFLDGHKLKWKDYFKGKGLSFDPPAEGEWKGLFPHIKDAVVAVFRCGRKLCCVILIVGISLIGITVFILWKTGIVDKIITKAI
jgi:hypothetical protein